jgi:hypothetical protein
MHYNIVHKSDLTYQPWHASTPEYAQQLLAELLKTRPDLTDHLIIVQYE